MTIRVRTAIVAASEFLSKNRVLGIFFLAEGLMLLAFEMVAPFGILLFTEVIGGSPAEYGVLTSIFFLALTLCAIPSGVVIATIGLRSSLIANYLIASISLAIRAVANTPIVFAIGRILQSPSGALSSVLAPLIVSNSVQKQNLGRAFSFYEMFISIPGVVAPLMGATLIGLIGYHKMFGIATGLLLVSTVLATKIRASIQPHQALRKKGFSWIFSLTKRELWAISWLMAICLIRSIGLTAVYTYVPLYMKSLGMSMLEIGGLYSIFDLVAVILVVPAGQLVDKIKHNRLFLLLDAAGSLCLSVICILNSPVFIVAGVFVIARIINMPGMIVLSVRTSTLLPEEYRPHIFALYSVITNSGIIAAPALAGFLLQTGGRYTSLFWLLGISALVYGILALLNVTKQ